MIAVLVRIDDPDLVVETEEKYIYGFNPDGVEVPIHLDWIYTASYRGQSIRYFVADVVFNDDGDPCYVWPLKSPTDRAGL